MSHGQSHGVFFTPPLPFSVPLSSSHVPRLGPVAPSNPNQSKTRKHIGSKNKSKEHGTDISPITRVHQDRGQASINNINTDSITEDGQLFSSPTASSSSVASYGNNKERNVVCESHKDIPTDPVNGNVENSSKNHILKKDSSKKQESAAKESHQFSQQSSRRSTSTFHSMPTSMSHSPSTTVHSIRRSTSPQLRRYRCSRCGQEGHNVRACAQMRWFKQRCGLCGIEGHNARSCQANKLHVPSHGRHPRTVTGTVGEGNERFDSSNLATVGRSLLTDEERMMANMARSRVSPRHASIKLDSDKEELIGGSKPRH